MFALTIKDENQIIIYNYQALNIVIIEKKLFRLTRSRVCQIIKRLTY